jgi:hypothetical protein
MKWTETHLVMRHEREESKARKEGEKATETAETIQALMKSNIPESYPKIH